MRVHPCQSTREARKALLAAASQKSGCLVQHLQRRADDEADPDDGEADPDQTLLALRHHRREEQQDHGGRRKPEGPVEELERAEEERAGSHQAGDRFVRLPVVAGRRRHDATLSRRARSARAVSREPCGPPRRGRGVGRRAPGPPGRVLGRVDAGLGLGADRVPDDESEVHDRDLQDQHHEDQFPGGAGHLGIVRDGTRAGSGRLFGAALEPAAVSSEQGVARDRKRRRRLGAVRAEQQARCLRQAQAGSAVRPRRAHARSPASARSPAPRPGRAWTRVRPPRRPESAPRPAPWRRPGTCSCTPPARRRAPRRCVSRSAASARGRRSGRTRTRRRRSPRASRVASSSSLQPLARADGQTREREQRRHGDQSAAAVERVRHRLDRVGDRASPQRRRRSRPRRAAPARRRGPARTAPRRARRGTSRPRAPRPTRNPRSHPSSLRDDGDAGREHVALLAREDVERRRGRLESVRAKHAPDRVEEERVQRRQVGGGRGTKLHDRRD